MGKRAEDLAAAFESANSGIISALEGLTPDQLQQPCGSEGWKPACVGHHVAVSAGALGGLVSVIANGQPVPAITMEMIDAGNAEHASQFGDVSREDTVAVLKSSGADAAALIRGLSDEQLDRSAPMAFAGGQEWSASDVIERILIGHPQEHAASIRAVAS